MTNPGAIGEADHLDEQIANSFGSKESSSLKSSRVPAPMPPEGCPEPHHAEVVACDLFATPNSLKSRVARKVLSPFSNIHAVTPKLRTHSTSTAIQNQWTSNVQRSISKRARCAVSAPLPAISCLGAFRPPAASARGGSRYCRRPKTYTRTDIMASSRSLCEMSSLLVSPASEIVVPPPKHRRGGMSD